VHDPVRTGQIMHVELRKHCPAWNARLQLTWTGGFVRHEVATGG
jgi:hypothetical protein